MKHICQTLFFVIAMLFIGCVSAAETIYDESNHEVCFKIGATERFAIQGNQTMMLEYRRYMQEGSRRVEEDPYFDNELCGQSIEEGKQFALEILNTRRANHHKAK